MINYEILHKSVIHFEESGYKRIESPWTVTKEISGITRPKDAPEFTITEKNKVLVASGEQSFLYLINKGFLPSGKYQTITPCFRDEPFDSFHTKYFMKNELIITDFSKHAPEDSLQDIMGCAMRFFNTYFKGGDVEKVKTGENQFDLEYKGVELGSYGIRTCDFVTWVYGTGVAEPRLTRTMKKFGIADRKLINQQ